MVTLYKIKIETLNMLVLVSESNSIKVTGILTTTQSEVDLWRIT